MEKIQSFKDLVAWQKAHQLALNVYKITRDFPQEERFGLIQQMRRCAVSVAANIAEGFKKRGEKDKINFFNISQGSLEEIKYYLILSKDLEYIQDTKEISDLAEETSRLLSGLIKTAAQAK